jgi:hypothetical protein
MPKFTIATLTIVALLFAGALLGGAWIWAALIYITVFAYGIDRLGPFADGNVDPDVEFPASDTLSAVLAIAHFIVLALVIYALTSNPEIATAHKVALFIATALFAGQIGHPNAHELIHRPDRNLRRLGKALYMSILMGHHASAHPLVHHVHCGTSSDPVSATKGAWILALLSTRMDWIVLRGLRGGDQAYQGAGPSSLCFISSRCCMYTAGRFRHWWFGWGADLHRDWTLCAAANFPK